MFDPPHETICFSCPNSSTEFIIESNILGQQQPRDVIAEIIVGEKTAKVPSGVV